MISLRLRNLKHICRYIPGSPFHGLFLALIFIFSQGIQAFAIDHAHVEVERAINRSHPQRVLDLPKDYSLGTLTITICRQGPIPGREYKVPAMGRVVIPAASRVTLGANDGLFKDPTIINKLAPDALDILTTLSRAFSYAEEGAWDRGLRYVGHLKHLQKLNIDHTDATDSGIVHAAEIPDLIELTVSDTHFTGAPLKQICALKKIAVLRLSDNNIDQASLKCLSNAPVLEDLALCRVRLTDEGMKYIGRCKYLWELDLAGCQSVNDHKLGFLQGLTRLHVLRVPDTGVTINGLLQLKGLPLKEIRLKHGIYKITDMEALRKAFTGVNLVVEQRDLDQDNSVIFQPLH